MLHNAKIALLSLFCFVFAALRATVCAAELQVAIVVFDPAIPPDAATHKANNVFPEVREAEARYYATVLRDTLIQRAVWGPVRVVPEPSLGFDLTIRSRLLRSDGLSLQLAVEAVDASETAWLSGQYVAHYTNSSDGTRGEAFQQLFDDVARDLEAQLSARNAEAHQRLQQITLLRYASSLAPDAFADYLTKNAESQWELQRLPALDDPMLRRIARIRSYEDHFVDQADEQYAALAEEMRPVYAQWLKYRHEQAVFQAGYEARLETRQERVGRAGSFTALERSYNTYKWFKTQEQDMDELALGLHNEVNPTVMEVDGVMFRLGGSLRQQYQEWRDILARLFTLEQGTPPG